MRAIDYFDRAVERYRDRTALVEDKAALSYGALCDATWRMARRMWGEGLSGPEPVGVWAPNSAAVLAWMLAVMRAGGVWSAVSPQGPPHENIDYLRHVRARWLLYHPDTVPDLQAVRDAVPTLQHCVAIEDSLWSKPKAPPEGIAVELPWATPNGNLERLVAIVPTGGSTGSPRAVRQSTLVFGTMIDTFREGFRFDDDVTCLSVAPLSHSAGAQAFAIWTLGGTNIVVHPFIPLEVMKLIERHRVTHIFLPPSALYLLMAQSQVKSLDHSSLRCLRIGGAPLSEQKLREASSIFGPCLCQTYGQIEAPMLTWLDQDTVREALRGKFPHRLRSCGKATHAVRIAVVEENGSIIPEATVGELVVRSRGISEGYLGDEARDLTASHDGWHHTGDLGYVDEHGFIYIVGRKRDVIISGGLNIIAADVEACAMAFPGVIDCVAIGVADDVAGEAVKLFVTVSTPSIGLERAILKHCRSRLGGAKAPRAVEILSALPRTSAGKIDKRALRSRPH